MPDDPLPLPDYAAAPASDADYEADYAEIAATDRGRSFLSNYADRSRHDDMRTLVDTIARLEAAMRDHLSARAAAALVRDLADLAATLVQIEALLASGPSAGSDVHFVIERIQDIAAALRQRDVAAALCDTLEAAAREVGDAIVRRDAAAERALSAAVALRELAHRVNDMMARIGTIASVAAIPDARVGPEDEPGKPNEPATPGRTQPSIIEAEGAAPEQTSGEAGRFDDTAQDSAAGDLRDGDESAVRAPLPATQAANDLDQGANVPFEPLPPLPSPLEQPPASESETVRMFASGAQPPAVVMTAATPAVARAAANDPFATLHALSEEELIALFS